MEESAHNNNTTTTTTKMENLISRNHGNTNSETHMVRFNQTKLAPNNKAAKSGYLTQKHLFLANSKTEL
jgi:hypothetical protein